MVALRWAESMVLVARASASSVARNALRCLMLMKEASIISCAWCRVRVWVGIGLGLGFGFGSVPRAG